MARAAKVLCWNSTCPAPHNPQDAEFCGGCGSGLWLGDRYQAQQILGQGASGRTWLAISRSNSPSSIQQITPKPVQPTLGQPVIVKHYAQAWLAQQQTDAEPRIPIRRKVSTGDSGLHAAECWPPRLQAMLQRWQQMSQLLGSQVELSRWIDLLTQDNDSYLIQTYCTGDSLEGLRAQKMLFSLTEVVDLLGDLLPLLEVMHRHGLIHGDIKPANILQRLPTPSSQPQFTLVDWSTALCWDPQTTRAPSQTAVQLQQPSGSPDYSAPEQLRGHPSPASDLYSLGLVCIHLLTGMHPFELWDATCDRWSWRPFWQAHAATVPASSLGETRQTVLLDLLDRLIDHKLGERMASASEAIATLKSIQPITTFSTHPNSITSWHLVKTLQGHQGLFPNVNAVAISSQSRMASASDDRTIRLWQFPTGKSLGILQGHTQAVQAVAFHPQDETCLVSSGRDRTIRLWHLRSQQSTRTFIGHTAAVLGLCFSPDGQQLLSSSADKTIQIWDVQTGEAIRALRGHRLAVTAIALVPQSPQHLVSASADATLSLWDWNTGERLHTFTGHTGAIRAIALSPDGRWLASGGEDRTICLWDLGAIDQPPRRLSGHSWTVSALQFLPDGHTLVSGSWDHRLKLWPLGEATAPAQLTGHTDSVSCLAISPNGDFILSGSHDATLKLWHRSSLVHEPSSSLRYRTL
jgi:WD40 repeat protein